ncbi:hypothetical protein QE450_003614 [Paenibacillus sp. SORGH_AS306]|uniref:hypothetical protein n=1 Tax=unclassified Paenibacillus TaxID=185978 RepID=UPI0027874EC2|nr:MULTISPECIES: hypothetical protein [unclassified Paenibacillus]MDQ1236116.1 hypothetical protein [Paenibacillus sp. SORGH_AS_0306]MDR6108471.1 hypothetical protein [Paenibacillus sp. SORGH_AS_0338]
MKRFITREEIIVRNSDFLYRLLIDFLHLEIHEDSFDLIYSFLAVPNFRNGEYEGNQYILRKVNNEDILIFDLLIEMEEVEEIEEGFDIRTLKLSVKEMLYIMDHIDYWRVHK